MKSYGVYKIPRWHNVWALAIYLVSVCLMDQMFGFIVRMVNLSWQHPVGHLTSIQVAILWNKLLIK